MSALIDLLHQAFPNTPDLAIILGSGINILENLKSPTIFSYQDLFGASPQVSGHTGQLSVGYINNKLIAIFKGRFHLYEGYDWELVTLPAKTIAAWGIPKVLLTNAAGGINTNFKIGDLMLLTGYLDFLNPKWHAQGLLPALQQKPVSCASPFTKQIEKIGTLQKGIYAGLLGPNYETLAEIEMLRRLKADAVGMSTVPEFLTLADTKCDVAAISIITNVWNTNAMPNHQEVLKAGQAASLKLNTLAREIIGS